MKLEINADVKETLQANRTMELIPDEMEAVNGGSIHSLIAVLGLVGGAIAMAVGIGYAEKNSGSPYKDGPNVFQCFQEEQPASCQVLSE